MAIQAKDRRSSELRPAQGRWKLSEFKMAFLFISASVLFLLVEEANSQNDLSDLKWLSATTGLAVLRFERPKIDAANLGQYVVPADREMDISHWVFKKTDTGFVGSVPVLQWVQKPEGPGIPEGGPVEIKLPPNESGWPPFRIGQNDIGLVAVSVVNGKLVGGPIWILGKVNVENVVRIEKKGLQQRQVILDLSKDTERARKYLEIVESGKEPSIVLVAEAFEIVNPDLADAHRIELAKGLALIITGEHAPDYVRRYATLSLVFLHMRTGDRAKIVERDLMILSVLSKGFHEYVGREGTMPNSRGPFFMPQEVPWTGGWRRKERRK